MARASDGEGSVTDSAVGSVYRFNGGQVRKHTGEGRGKQASVALPSTRPDAGILYAKTRCYGTSTLRAKVSLTEKEQIRTGRDGATGDRLYGVVNNV